MRVRLDPPAALSPASSEIAICPRAGCRVPLRLSARVELANHWCRRPHESCWSIRLVTARTEHGVSGSARKSRRHEAAPGHSANPIRARAAVGEGAPAMANVDATGRTFAAGRGSATVGGLTTMTLRCRMLSGRRRASNARIGYERSAYDSRAGCDAHAAQRPE
jgi:hypothetical protein